MNVNGAFEIIKNDAGMEHTPSVFGFDPAGNPRVGSKAYDKLFQSPNAKDMKNYKAEVKRLMGTQETMLFESARRDMSPEEVSAEILKYLKESVLKRYPDTEFNGAVITVPAHFSTLQSEATKRA